MEILIPISEAELKTIRNLFIDYYARNDLFEQKQNLENESFDTTITALNSMLKYRHPQLGCPILEVAKPYTNIKFVLVQEGDESILQQKLSHLVVPSIRHGLANSQKEFALY